ncbi:MAG: phosphatase PAP2 family protein [Bacteroidetes bacterium]|nr:phosphatase PAP2 family protein [Bacteroidota bacterium]
MVLRWSFSIVILFNLVVCTFESKAQHANTESFFVDTGSKLLLPATLTLVALTIDHHVSYQAYTARNTYEPLRSITKTLSQYGNTLTAGCITLYGIYALGWNDTIALLTSEQIVYSLALTSTVGMLLKHVFGRERPYSATSASGTWHGPVVTLYPSKRNGKPLSSYTSFPSGHALASFCVATVFADAYPQTAVPLVSYSLATLITASRIPEHQHWLSDCLAGAFLGYIGAKLSQQWVRTSVIVFTINTPSSFSLTLSKPF